MVCHSISAWKEGLTLKKIILAFITLFLGVCFLSPAKGEESIRIGALLSVTGPGSSMGEAQKNTLLMIQDQINFQGGILGKSLEILVYDDETDVNMCLLAVKKLLGGFAPVAIIGPTTSGNTLALVNIIQGANIPLISLAQAEKIVRPPKKWVFKTPPSNRLAVTKVLTHAKSKGVNTIAIVSSLDGSGQMGRHVLKELIPQMGFQLLADDVYRPMDIDVTTQLSKFVETGPDALIFWGIGEGAAAIARKRIELELPFTLYISHTAVAGKFIPLAGKASEGVLLPSERVRLFDQIPYDHPQRDPIDNFRKDYESRYGVPPPPAGSYAWDALFLILRAIEMGNSYNPADIRDNLEMISGFAGTVGIFNYSYGEHGGLKKDAFEMVVIRKRRFSIHR